MQNRCGLVSTSTVGIMIGLIKVSVSSEVWKKKYSSIRECTSPHRVLEREPETKCKLMERRYICLIINRAALILYEALTSSASMVATPLVCMHTNKQSQKLNSKLDRALSILLEVDS